MDLSALVPCIMKGILDGEMTISRRKAELTIKHLKILLLERNAVVHVNHKAIFGHWEKTFESYIYLSNWIGLNVKANIIARKLKKLKENFG